jgi:hypothetical protein
MMTIAAIAAPALFTLALIGLVALIRYGMRRFAEALERDMEGY